MRLIALLTICAAATMLPAAEMATAGEAAQTAPDQPEYRVLDATRTGIDMVDENKIPDVAQDALQAMKEALPDDGPKDQKTQGQQ